MPFTKGNTLSKGRPTGAVSVRVTEWQSIRDYCLNRGSQNFIEELDKLKGKDYVHAFLSLLEFYKPRMARIEQDLPEDTKQLIVSWINANNDSLRTPASPIGLPQPDQTLEPRSDSPSVR